MENSESSPDLPPCPFCCGAEPATLTDDEIREIAVRLTNRYIVRGEKHKALDVIVFARELQARFRARPANKKGF